MSEQRSSVKRVQQVAALLGVCFVQSINNRGTFAATVTLQIYFFIYTSITSVGSLNGVNRLFNFILLSIPVILPIFIELAINIEAYVKVQLDQKIEREFVKLDEVFRADFKQEDIPGVKFCVLRFAGKLFILIVVRPTKMFYSGVFYSLNTMITELVLSTCEYKFAFDIDLLGAYIKAYADSVRVNTSTQSLNFRKHYLIFYKLSKLISRRYSLSMFLIITFNFITIVTCLYWVFIRVVHGPMR